VNATASRIAGFLWLLALPLAAAAQYSSPAYDDPGMGDGYRLLQQAWEKHAFEERERQARREDAVTSAIAAAADNEVVTGVAGEVLEGLGKRLLGASLGKALGMVPVDEVAKFGGQLSGHDWDAAAWTWARGFVATLAGTTASLGAKAALVGVTWPGWVTAGAIIGAGIGIGYLAKTGMEYAQAMPPTAGPAARPARPPAPAPAGPPAGAGRRLAGSAVAESWKPRLVGPVQLTLNGTRLEGRMVFTHAPLALPTISGGDAKLPSFRWQLDFEGTLDLPAATAQGTLGCRVLLGTEPVGKATPACGTFSGTLDGEALRGTWRFDAGKGPVSGTFVASGGAGGGSGLRVDDATAALGAAAGPVITGKCALHVQRALEAGGIDGAGHPAVAHEYGPYLASKGFLALPADGYAPRKGDVVVVQPGQGVSKAGHIAMYDGSQWISDYRETSRWESTNRADRTTAAVRQFYRP
jgi:hypothetical protein